MKNKTSKRTKEKSIKVHFENPQEGVNFERFFMALSLLLSEKDILECLNRYQEDLPPNVIKHEILAQTS